MDNETDADGVSDEHLDTVTRLAARNAQAMRNLVAAIVDAVDRGALTQTNAEALAALQRALSILAGNAAAGACDIAALLVRLAQAK